MSATGYSAVGSYSDRRLESEAPPVGRCFPISPEVLSMCDAATHKVAISDLLVRFFQAFDDKDWPMMRECLWDEVFTDYSSFRGVPAGTLPAGRYVAQRRSSLEAALEMRHRFLNLRVEVESGADTAIAFCDYIIHRYHPSFVSIDNHYFHSYGHYVFAFLNERGAWRISRITQHVVRSHGGREIQGTSHARDGNV